VGNLPDSIVTLLRMLHAQGEVIAPSALHELLHAREDPRDTIARSATSPTAQVENVEHQLIRVQAGILEALNDVVPQKVAELFEQWEAQNPCVVTPVELLDSSDLKQIAEVVGAWLDTVYIHDWWLWQSAFEGLITYRVTGLVPERLKMPYSLAISKADDDLTLPRLEEAAATFSFAAKMWEKQRAWWKHALEKNGITTPDAQMTALITESFTRLESNLNQLTERIRNLAATDIDYPITLTSSWNPDRESRTSARARLLKSLNGELDRIGREAGRVQSVKFPDARSFERFVKYQTGAMSRNDIAEQEKTDRRAVDRSIDRIAALAGIEIRLETPGRPVRRSNRENRNKRTVRFSIDKPGSRK